MECCAGVFGQVALHGQLTVLGLKHLAGILGAQTLFQDQHKFPGHLFMSSSKFLMVMVVLRRENGARMP